MRFVTIILMLAASPIGRCDDLDPFAHLGGHATDSRREALRFGNTSRWAPRFLAHTKKTPVFLPDNWRSKIAAAQPPANSSLRTRAEVDYLLSLQEKRTPDDIERIERERKLEGFRFGELLYPEFTDPGKHPATAALAEVANAGISIVIFQAKLHFDRVRPSELDDRIRPAIAVPEHPSYPSGHATQAYMWAYLLCELHPPERHESFIAGARLIATDRELAGVHYPSDTALGRRIARQVVDMWMANPEFRKLVEAAKGELKSGGE